METIISDQVEMKNKKLNKIDEKFLCQSHQQNLMQSMKESVNLKTDQYKLQNITQRKGEKVLWRGGQKKGI